MTLWTLSSDIHNQVRQQAQRVGDGLHLLVLFGLVAGDAADVDSALQGIDGLAAVEHAQR